MRGWCVQRHCTLRSPWQLVCACVAHSNLFSTVISEKSLFCLSMVGSSSLVASAKQESDPVFDPSQSPYSRLLCNSISGVRLSGFEKRARSTLATVHMQSATATVPDPLEAFSKTFCVWARTRPSGRLYTSLQYPRCPIPKYEKRLISPNSGWFLSLGGGAPRFSGEGVVSLNDPTAPTQNTKKYVTKN